MRIHLDFEVSQRQKRWTKIVAVASVILGGSVALANVPNTFKDGDSLSVQTMNDNFGSLDQRLSKLEALNAKETADGGFALGATYCGATSTTTGDLSGLAASGTDYVKARNQCQITCGAPTAHFCSGDEVTRSYQLGIALPRGWYESGAARGGAYSCGGWTTSASSDSAAITSTIPNGPSYITCNSSYPLLCCN